MCSWWTEKWFDPGAQSICRFWKYIFGGGFPCTDLSALKFNRENLEGKNSVLFWEIPRIRKLLQDEFGDTVKVKYAVENVASMDETAAGEISRELETMPYLLDPVHL